MYIYFNHLIWKKKKEREKTESISNKLSELLTRVKGLEKVDKSKPHHFLNKQDPEQ